MKVSKETVDAIRLTAEADLLDYIKDCRDEDGTSDLQHQSLIGLFEADPSVENLVSIIISLAWDLESFTDWVLENIENSEDAKALLGEGVHRMHEWDT